MAFAWFDAGDGRKVYRRIPEGSPKARSVLPCPMLIKDFDEPVQSMADGKWYSSKSALAASHRASGNPYGQDFIELGNEQMPFVEHKTDEKKLRDDIRAAKADLDAGWRPEVVALED
ncbi:MULTISPECIES: hypothetical protein [Chelativorans]|jgi:hypothetical protein|uniref:Uncharacterized protein n=1 Tax=Chelativorans sp. (strain BNC1) TaxID=266779 RepID=Q11LU4_CHESB|nr:MULTISPECIES: hypothetical protein [Chelativorans]